MPRVATGFAAALALLSASARAEDLSGLWTATTQVSGVPLPFALSLSQSGEALSGHFFDGPRPNTPSTAGAFKDGKVHLEFPSYAAAIDAVAHDGVLEGQYVAAGKVWPLRAVHQAPPAEGTPAPDISGEWIIPFESAKGEKAWRLIIEENPAKGRAFATILRIDGDTGSLSGVWRDGAFRLTHFAGERAAVLEIRPGAAGTLDLSLADTTGVKTLSAIRPEVAAARGVVPDDPGRHTTVRNPDEPLRFAFPDLTGKVVANDDPRFKGKVVMVNLMGSWCPNCHDEAPFLEALYRRHHDQGLEIVALDFEQAEHLGDLRRLKAFIARYGLSYTVLVAGQPKEVNDKLPQAVGLNAWPTTFIIGRDGKVRGAHVGFTSPGSGEADARTRSEIEETVRTLLAEPAP